MVYAVSKYNHISVKKVNQVLKLIRKTSYLEGLKLLSHLPKKSARMIEKTLKSAAANFNQKFKDSSEDQWFIKEAIANRGPYYKRLLPRSRGSANRIQKPLCHLRIVLAEIKKGKK